MEVASNVDETDAPATPRKHPNASARVLQLLTDLVTEDATKRVKVCRQLVSHAVALSKQPSSSSALEYIVSRLVRGLGSSRPGARASLFTALVGTLSAVPSDRLSSVSVLQCCPAAAPPAAADNRARVEHVLCVLLTSGALVRAHRLELELGQLTAGLWSGWSFKSYMPSLATPFLVSLITQLDDKRFSVEMWPLLKDRLSVGWSHCSEDLLWLLVVCRSNFPAVCSAEFLQQHWGCKKLFSPEAYSAMIKVVKSSAVHLPTIHPSVTALFDCAVDKSSRLLTFCQLLIEPLLADRAACPLAQALLQMVVPRLSSPQLVRAVLTPAVVSSLVRSLPKRDLVSENGARGLASALSSLALHPDTSASTQMALLGCLMARPGSVCFDAITGTKLLSIIVGALKPVALQPFVDLTTEIFNGELDGEKQTDRGRAMACVFLSRAVLHSSSPPISLKLRVLTLLFDTSIAGEDSNVADEIVLTARRQFFKAVIHPVRQPMEQERLLWQLCSHQLVHVQAAAPSLGLRPAATKIWLEAVKQAEEMRKSEVAAEWESGGGRLLLAVSVLMLSLCQLLLESVRQTELHTFLCDVLKDVCACVPSFTSHVTAAVPDSSSPGTDEDTSRSGAVLDIILNVLSLLNSHSVRSVVREVFSVMVPALSRAELLRFFSVLSADYSLQEDFSDEEDDEKDENGEDSDSDSAECNGDVDSDTDDSGIDREDAADESVPDDDDEEEGGDKLGVYTLRERLQSALAGVAEDDGASDIDMDQVPAEHFEKIDAALAKTFRALKKNKGDKGRKKADKEMSLMNFRIRVLDLVDVCARACTGSLACLDLLPVLVSLLATVYLDRHQVALVNRLRSSLTLLCSNSCRTVKDPQLNGEYLAEIMHVLLEEGSRLPSASVDMGSSLAAAVRAVVRNSVQLPEQQAVLVTNTILSALDRFLYNRECILPPRMFSQLFSLPDWAGKQQLLLKLSEAAGDQLVRCYRRCQSVAMLTTALQQPAALSCMSGKQVRCLADRLMASFHQTVDQLEGNSTCTDSATSGVNERLLCVVFEATMLSIRVALRQCGPKSGAKCRQGAQRVLAVMHRLGPRVNRGRCGKLYRKLISLHRLDSDGMNATTIIDQTASELAEEPHDKSEHAPGVPRLPQVLNHGPPDYLQNKKRRKQNLHLDKSDVSGKRSCLDAERKQNATENSSEQNKRKKKKLK